MPALVRPILIERGATLSIKTLVNSGGALVNLTGHSAKFEVRRVARPLLPPVLSLVPGSGIVLQADGLVFVTATPAQTRSLVYVPGRRYEYALSLLTPNGAVNLLASGLAVISRTITTEIPPPPLLMTQPMTATEPPADYSWITSQ